MTAGIGGYTVGKDCTISLVLRGTKTSFTLPELTSISIPGETTVKEIIPINGDPDALIFWKLYKGSIKGERQDSTMEDLWDLLETSYYNRLPAPPMELHITIQETDGSITNHQFTKVQFSNFHMGEIKGDDTVSWSADLLASRQFVTH